MSFSTVLIANRGEIALRIQRSCRALGLGVVAVFSDADEGAPWVRAADRAVRLGPADARASYLRGERLIEAAKASGADAIHPGYGFLSEDAGFAASVAAAGLTFVGPPAEVIRRLGDKREAKAIAAAAGLPVVPGFDPTDRGSLRYPLLVKASAGGGGKGMRIVRGAGELDEALDAARREAAAAFGDDTLLVERYLERPRHIEVQILADAHGAVVHLGERECSIQRRYQKIVEESPAPALDGELRERLTSAAVALARAVGYVNAGTVEMILAADGAFYFLEVNTRLQVEHPVTELVTGLDLVREQLRVARGEPLGYGQEAIVRRGHAVEVRLYAEDPATGFLPTTGRVVDWHWPVPGVRLDAGVEVGDEVGIHYDPLLAKVIAHAERRADALALLAGALERASVLGLTCNRELLVRLLRDADLVAGRLDTHFLDRRTELLAPADDPAALDRAALAAAVAALLAAPRPFLPALPPGFRNVPNPAPQVRYRIGDREVAVAARAVGERIEATVDDRPAALRVAWSRPPELAVEDAGGVVRRFRVARVEGVTWVHDGQRSHALIEVARFPVAADAALAGSTGAPMPGRVVKLLAAPGEAIRAGQPLLVLEAMKMEHTVRATAAGTIERFLVAAGDQVALGAPLVVVA